MDNSATIEAFRRLEGRWTLRRCFHNPKMQGLTATGQALFSRSEAAESGGEEVLDFLEQGTLSNGSSFTKAYRYLLTGRGIVVTHQDPHNRDEPFQTLVFESEGEDAEEVVFRDGQSRALFCQASNLCGQDLYDSSYRLALGTDEATLTTDHRVTGPRKDYRIETRFRSSLAKP